MSIYATTSTDSEWPSYRFQSHSTTDLTLGGKNDVGLGLEYCRNQAFNTESRPVLRSHRSFPYSLSSSTYPATLCQSSLNQITNPGATKESPSAVEDSKGPSATATASTGQMTYSDSLPTSPTSCRRSSSVGADLNVGAEDEDEMLMSAGELDEDGRDGSVPKTAAERRAEKRKMKRFRLTHNQTRFLMSEFARQAHPDAAQRERLSKEIPGLTPRQVQVWFQNRRAKLKRLTSDDRDRMMKSRALPDDFDMTQALHSPFGNVPQPFSTPLASPASYASTFTDGGIMRPLMIDGLRRQSEDDVTISPLSMSSTYGSFYTPPGSIPPSENLSPTSPVSERSNLMSSSTSQNASPRGTNPFIRSSSFSATYHPHSHIPRLQMHDRISRTRAESLASPLRSSMSYTGNIPDYGAAQASNAGAPSQQSPWENPKPSSFSSVSASYNAGYPNALPQGFQSSILSRPRPTITTFPPTLDLRPQYRPLLPMSTIQQVQSPQGFQSAPLTTPQDFSLPQIGAPYQTSIMNPTYTVPYGGIDSYGRSEPSNSGRIIEEPAEDQYHLAGSVDAAQLPSVRHGIPEAGNGIFNLQPVFGSGRRRSFTLPNDFTTSQS